MKKKRINKRVYALALAALLSASAVSCGNTYSNQKETESKVAETTSTEENDGIMSTAEVQRSAVQSKNQETESDDTIETENPTESGNSAESVYPLEAGQHLCGGSDAAALPLECSDRESVDPVAELRGDLSAGRRTAFAQFRK